MVKAFKVCLSAVAAAVYFCALAQAAPPMPGFPTPPQYPSPPQFPTPPVMPPFPPPAPPFPTTVPPYPPPSPVRLPNFGVRVLASDLPGPARLTIKGPHLFWSQGGDNPVQRMTINGGEPETMAVKMGVPEGLLAAGRRIYWIDGFKLKVTDIEARTTSVLSEGTKNFGESALATDGKFIYWVNSKKGPARWTINRVPVAGGASSIIADAPKAIVSLVFDNGYVYWEEAGTGPRKADGSSDSLIRKVPAAGGAAATVVDGGLNGLMPPLSPEHPVPGWQPAGGMAIANGEIYFSRTSYMKETDKIFKVPAAGGPVTPVGEIARPAVRIVSDGESVYWADPASINKVPAGGGKAVALARDLHYAADLAVGREDVYWTETVCCAHGQTGSIKKVSKAGGKFTVLAEGVDAPGPIAAGNGEVFWGEGGPVGLTEGFGRIAMYAADGSVVTVAGGVSGDRLPIAVDNLNIYVADRFTIKRIPFSGGPAEKLAGSEVNIVDLTADGLNVYWIEGARSTVKKVPVNGGQVTAITTGSGPAGRITTDGTNIYWVDHFDTIKKIGVLGVSSRFESVIASDLGYVTDIAVDGGSVFFLEDNARDIKSVSTSGGPAARLVSFITPPGSIAVDRANLYWADQAGVGEVPRRGGPPVTVATDLASDPVAANSIATDGLNVYWTEAGGGTIKTAPR